MAYHVAFSALATRDVDSIFLYISEELASPQAAYRIIDSIFNAVERLKDFPYSTPSIEELFSVPSPHRVLTVRDYCCFYRVTENDVIIDRVIHNRAPHLDILGLADLNPSN